MGSHERLRQPEWEAILNGDSLCRVKNKPRRKTTRKTTKKNEILGMDEHVEKANTSLWGKQALATMEVGGCGTRASRKPIGKKHVVPDLQEPPLGVASSPLRAATRAMPAAPGRLQCAAQ